MNIVLWVLQVLLGLAFVFAGFLKATTPVEKLGKQMEWVKHTTTPIVRLVGILEILGGLGVILPAATHILPWLTPVAAACLALTMLVAIIIHFVLKEPAHSVAPVILLVIALVIVYGRFVLVPLT